jgi:hypothetical protein
MASQFGPNKNVLRSNTGVQDALLHNPDQSAFSFQAPMTISNFLIEEQEFGPYSFSGQFGQTYRFDIGKTGDLLGPLELELDMKPITQPPAPLTTNVSEILYCDNFGIGSIDMIEIQYGSNLICRIPPEALYCRFRKYLNQEAYFGWRTLSRMDQTLAERRAFSVAGGKSIVTLCVPWGDDTSQYLAICGLAQNLTINIRMKALNHILNYVTTDGLAPATALFGTDTVAFISRAVIHGYVVQLTGSERDTVVANVKSENGVPILSECWQTILRVPIPVQATAFTYNYRLASFNAPTASIFWWLEDPQNTSGIVGVSSGTTGSVNGGDWPLHPEDYLMAQVSSYQLAANSVTLTPAQSMFRARWRDHIRWFSSPHAGEPLVGYSWSVAPEITNASYGTINFGQMDNVNIFIVFPAGLSNVTGGVNAEQGAYFCIIADTKNFIHEQGGDLIQTFCS